MEASYTQQFPDRKFNNYRKDTLAGKVTVVDKSHRKLVELMTTGPVVGIMTVPLQGFSVHGQREQMSELSAFDFVSLAGGFDFATAMVGYPETLARDYNTPGLDMSALQWQSSGDSLCLKASDDGCGFVYEGSLGGADGRDSGGLFFRG